MRALRLALVFALLGLGPRSAPDLAAQIPLNLGFERPAVEGFSRPWGWTLVARADGGEFSVDSVIRRSAARSLRIARSPGDGDQAGEHALRHWIAPRFAWGERVRLTGWVRTEDLDGEARLVLEAWGAEVLASDSAALMGGRDAPADERDAQAGGRDAEQWQALELSIFVDSTAHSLVVTAGLRGTGTVWFDDLSVEVGGRTWDAVPAADAPTAATIDWLTARSHPFSTVDAGPAGTDDFRDLEPLGDIVGDARLVALGEATHGSSEFFRVKHRLLAYLVDKKGFGVFAIEANQLAVEPINRYVRGAPGDIGVLMRAMFQVWNTEEMRDLIEWMRAHNVRHPDRMVEFVGFDMQDPAAPIDSVSAFLARVEPTIGPPIDSLYAAYRDAWREAYYPQGALAVRRSWYENALLAYERIQENRDDWLASAADRTDSAAVEWALQNANVVRQAALVALTGEFADRDSAMAENIGWVLERRPPDTRVVVWAHDGHISRAAHEWANYWGGGSMGGELSRLFGDDYRAFGLLTYAGSYSGASGRQIIDTRLLPAPVGSLEEALHRVGLRLGASLLITDLRGAATGPAGGWLMEPRLIRMIGYAAEDLGFATGISVGSQFDGIVFVDTTSPSRVLRR